ncbi:MAG: biotin transporter BioY [Lachnospiraceae bacterium]|nr:biotin transporter BioY [Lachnospiraceae bacterium]
MKIKDMVSVAVMAAVICILTPLSVPIGPIPISLANFIILLTVYILGTKKAFLSVLIFLLIGLAGAPVFSGFQGGIAKLAGPTGGFLIGYLPMVLIAGAFIEKSRRKLLLSMAGMMIATAVLYALGTAWFVSLTGKTLAAALALCVTPFIVLDLAKMLVVALVGPVLYNALVKAGVLDRAVIA